MWKRLGRLFGTVADEPASGDGAESADQHLDGNISEARFPAIYCRFQACIIFIYFVCSIAGVGRHLGPSSDITGMGGC